MKLHSLVFHNFKGIRDVTFEINEKSSVFIGVNGVGKSSILRGINLLYSRIINKIVKNRFKQGINIELSDISSGMPECKIEAEFMLSNGTIVPYNRAMERKSKGRVHNERSLVSIYEVFETLHLLPDSNMPIFVNYGVNRLVLDVPIRIRTKHTFDKESAFEKAIESRIDFRTFFEWFRHQEDYENEQKARNNRAYVDIPLQSVRTAIMNMFEEEKFTGLRIERSPLSMVVNKGKTSLRIEQLSDGEKCTLALIGDLARRLALANPASGKPLEGAGVVLIDEIELHMHPKWQREILAKLKKTFPNIQFIITTHSPQVLGEIDSDINVFSLKMKEGNLEYVNVSPLKGWNSNYILEDYMETSSLNRETKELIHSMYIDFENRHYDDAKNKAAQLERLTDSAHEEVVKINILLKRAGYES
jgi:predicted ATP-binding protein involved in virulence